MNTDKTILDGPIMAGVSIGLVAGFCCWFLLGFMGLPKFLIYVSGVWLVEPVLRYFGLFGEINLLLPALFVCVLSFSMYGFILGAIVAVFARK